MSTKPKPPQLKTMLLDAAVPLEQRRKMFQFLFMDENKESVAVLDSILQAAAAQNGEDLHAKKIQELSDLIQQMNAGPLRYGTFLSLLAPKGPVQRAHVLLQDGTSAYTIVPDLKLAKS